MPGDLLFFRRSGRESFHSMIYLGASQIGKDANRYLVYHTGPGEVWLACDTLLERIVAIKTLPASKNCTLHPLGGTRLGDQASNQPPLNQ